MHMHISDFVCTDSFSRESTKRIRQRRQQKQPTKKKQKKIQQLDLYFCLVVAMKIPKQLKWQAKHLQANDGNRVNKTASGALIWVEVGWRRRTLLRYFIIFHLQKMLPSPTKPTERLMGIIIPNLFLLLLSTGCLTRPRCHLGAWTHLFLSTDIADDGVGGRTGRGTEDRHHPFRHDLAHWEKTERERERLEGETRIESWEETDNERESMSVAALQEGKGEACLNYLTAGI